jgi:hypothetical protein
MRELKWVSKGKSPIYAASVWRCIMELLDQEGCGVAACRLDHALVSVESEMEESGPSAPKAARLH